MSSAYYAGSTLSTAEQLALDARLSSLETTLLMKAPSNPFGGNAAIIGEGALPAISGLQLVPKIGTLTVMWSPSPASNLLYYEIAISKTNDFTNPVTVRWTQTQFTYVQGISGITYYVRVRAVDQNYGVGAWSSVLNSATGLATSSDLAFQTATNVSTYTTTNFYPEQLFTYPPPPYGSPPWWADTYPSTAIGIWGSAPILTKGGMLIVIPTLVATIGGGVDAGGTGVRISSQLTVDGEVIGDPIHYDIVRNPDYTWGGDELIPLPLDPFDTATAVPIVGIHFVGVRITLQNNNFMSNYVLIPVSLKLTLLELRR